MARVPVSARCAGIGVLCRDEIALDSMPRRATVACQTVCVLMEEAEQVVAALRSRAVFAHVQHMGVNRVGIRVVLPTGAEAIWDADGAAGLEAQVMRDGVLVGFVPVIPGSADFDLDQTVEAIAAADYGTV